MKIKKQIPCTVRKVKNGVFLKVREIFLENLDKKIANSIISGIALGIDRDNSNAILVVYE